MESSNLISLFRSFSTAEMKEFDKFLRSPFFTEGSGLRHKILYSYFKELRSAYPEFSKELNKTLIYSKLYPGKKYDDNTIRKINSDLCSLAEQFLIQLELNENPKLKKRLRLIQLQKRRIEKLYNARFKEMIKYLESCEKDEEYYYETYNTHKHYYGFYYSTGNIYKLNESVDFVDKYFIYVIMASLSIYLWALSVSRTSTNKIDLRLFEEIMQHVNQNYSDFDTIPQIHIYFNLILLTTSAEEKYFKKLKELKKKNFDKLSMLDKNNLHIMMTNFCHDKINMGLSRFRSERFLLDNDYLENELYKESGFHISIYLAIAKNAIRLGKFKWTKSFCENNIQHLSTGLREFAYRYILAEIAFAERDFSLALKLLSKLKIEQSNHKQSTKNLMLQIYYETKDDEAAISLIDSGKHFLQNDKHLSRIARENSGNFIKYLEKLIKLRENKDPDTLAELRERAAAAANMHNREWLIEKIEQQLNKHYT